MRKTVLTLALMLALPTLRAQTAPDTPLSAADRHGVIETLDAKLQSHYVFPDVARTLAAAIRARETAGAYAVANDVEAFADALSKDLRELGRDDHFNVGFDPDFRERPDGARTPPSEQEIVQERRNIARHALGIDSVARLPGNVGYMELRGFPPTELVGESLSAAMTLLSGTDALIIDLRRNGGGEPSTVAYLMSHFFALGDERHLNDLYMREGDTTRQYWTSPSVGTRYLKPVYVLTSARTFSGGEEFAYDMQTQKRGKTVGEATGGGANPGEPYSLGGGFVAFIPNGRAINPVTGTNWEHVGVKPDIAAPAADAKRVAHAEALKSLVAASHEAEEKAGLQALIAKVEADRLDPPSYVPPRR